MSKKKLVIIAGPTAVGKTEYAIKYAKANNGEIVSLDTVQMYKLLDIGSAKPSMEELAEVKHYMIDEFEPDVNLSVKEFKEVATRYIEEIYIKGKLPILVGGSGFYINAILYDTEFLYEDDTEAYKVRNELYDLYNEKGIDYIYDILKNIDIEATKYIDKNNVKRVIRAIEFYKLHNMPISEHNRLEKMKESPYDYTYYVLNMERDRLYERINRRVDLMIEKGLLKEVKLLIDRGFGRELNSMMSIGYKELYDFVRDRDIILSIDDLNDSDKKELNIIIDEIKKHSRNYAKRQLTWFRSQKNIIWKDV